MVLKVHPTVVHYHFTWCFIGDGRGTVRQTVPRPGVLLDVVDSELRLAWRRDDWRRHDDDRLLQQRLSCPAKNVSGVPFPDCDLVEEV